MPYPSQRCIIQHSFRGGDFSLQTQIQEAERLVGRRQLQRGREAREQQRGRARLALQGQRSGAFGGPRCPFRRHGDERRRSGAKAVGVEKLAATAAEHELLLHFQEP